MGLPVAAGTALASGEGGSSVERPEGPRCDACVCVCVRAGWFVGPIYVYIYVQIYVYLRVRAYAPTHLGLGGGHVGIVGVRAREVVLELVGRHVARLLVPCVGGWVVLVG